MQPPTIISLPCDTRAWASPLGTRGQGLVAEGRKSDLVFLWANLFPQHIIGGVSVQLCESESSTPRLESHCAFKIQLIPNQFLFLLLVLFQAHNPHPLLLSNHVIRLLLSERPVAISSLSAPSAACFSSAPWACRELELHVFHGQQTA